MKLKILLSVAANYMALVGLGLIFAPQSFGAGAVPADASAALIAYPRLWGSPLLAIAALNWRSRNAEPSTALKAVILGNIVGFAAIASLHVWCSFSGGRPVTKVFALIHLIFAVAFVWAWRTGMSARRSPSGRHG